MLILLHEIFKLRETFLPLRMSLSDQVALVYLHGRSYTHRILILISLCDEYTLHICVLFLFSCYKEKV